MQDGSKDIPEKKNNSANSSANNSEKNPVDMPANNSAKNPVDMPANNSAKNPADIPANNSADNADTAKLHKDFLSTCESAIQHQKNKDYVTSVYKYCEAYLIAKKIGGSDLNTAIEGLKNAWEMVIDLKERPLAEHILELLSQQLNDEELKQYVADLNGLMTQKLKDIGFPIDDIEQHLKNRKQSESQKRPGFPAEGDNKGDVGDRPDSVVVKRDVVKYKDLVGYEKAIHFMRSKGFGTNADSNYSRLVKRLNAEHGLDRAVFSETLVFKSHSRDDAKVFMQASAGEIGLPVISMHVDESVSGSNVLCMMAPARSDFCLNPSRTGFNGKGILILEDVDMWNFAVPEHGQDDGIGGFLAAQMARGAAEILNLIDIAIADPNILVMASILDTPQSEMVVNQIFDSYNTVFIDYPTEIERASIWTELADDHPSLRAFSIQKLVQYSKKMSRYDIQVAVHDALEEAYKAGIRNKKYVPLTLLNITEKLAEHQPLESSEYKQLEDAAIEDFKKSIEDIDDILK